MTHFTAKTIGANRVRPPVRDSRNRCRSRQSHCHRTTRVTRSRQGVTIPEVIVAVVLLGLTVGMTSRFVSSVNQGLRDRELESRLALEMENAREQIGSWSAADITVERIANLTISEPVLSRCQNAAWVAKITRVDRPAQALRIDLAFQCTLQEQAIEPQRLVFWVPLQTPDESTGQLSVPADAPEQLAPAVQQEQSPEPEADSGEKGEELA